MRHLLFVGFLLWTGGAASAQAVVDGFSLDQIDFDAVHSGKVPCSEYGQAGFAVRQVPGLIQYVQVIAKLAGSNAAPAWIVRNVPAVASMLTEGTPVNLTLLGTQRGTCLVGAKLSYNISVTDNAIAIPPAYLGNLTAFLGRVTERAEGVAVNAPGKPGLPPAPTPAVAFLAERALRADGVMPLGDVNASFIERPGMGNVIQGTNECAPAAVANSMHWLEAQQKIDLGGDTPAQSLTKLKSDTSWNAEKGATPQTIIEGKLKFVQRAEHPLDLDIHYATFRAGSQVGDSVTVGTGIAKRDGPDSPPTFEYIRREMEKGQDVELSVRWIGANEDGNLVPVSGHAVAVSGIFASPDGDTLYINDDQTQDGLGTHLRTNHMVPTRPLRSNDGKPLLGMGGMTLNFIDTVYAESPKPQLYLYVPLELTVNLAALQAAGKDFTTPGRPASVFRAAVTGAPSAAPGSPFASGSQAVASATALGKFVYTANYGANNVSAFKIDPATGSLTPITGSPFAVRSSPFAVVTDPTGRLLYVANSDSANISAFTIDPITGVLTPVAGSPFATSQIPAGLAISPSGRLLFSAANSGGVSVYTIDVPTGTLTPVPGSPFAAGSNPNAVAVEAKGRFVYVVNAAFGTTNGGVSAFRIGPTGALTAVPGSPFRAGAQPDYIAIDPTGKFAYVSNFVSSNVTAFSINADTGALTQITGSPYTVPAGPFAIGVEPGGEYVYVTSQGNNPGSISVFALDATTGALTPIQGSPFPGGAGPARFAFASVSPTVSRVNPVPQLTQLAPSGAKPGAGVTVVTVYGSNFLPGSVVRWNGGARYTVFESKTQLNVAIPASDLAQAGTAAITVSNPNGGTSASQTFTINAALALPAVTGDATLNDAGFTIGQAVAPGSIATSFGSALASGTSALTSPPSNTVLGSRMQIDGRTAPLFFVSSGQVAFQVPWELAGQQRGFATFSSAVGTSAPATVSLAEYAPGIFTMNAANQGAVVINATGELVAQTSSVPGIVNRPAVKGEFIAIYCTGLGDVANRPATGAPASTSVLSRTIATPSITIGGVAAAPVFSGLAPGYVGLYQVVVQVPDAAPTGNAVPMVVSIGGQSSNTVTIAVR